MTKTELLRQLSASDTTVATIIGPKLTLNEWPAFEAELIAKKWQPRNDGRVYDEPGTGRFIAKPVIHRVRVGTFTKAPHGKNYNFNWSDAQGARSSHGVVADLKPSKDGRALELLMSNGNTVRYESSLGEAT